MDAKYINAFIESVRSVFATMVHLDVTPGKPRVVQSLPSHEVSGIIALSGDVVGSVVLSFPGHVASAVIARFSGNHLAIGSPDFADALGELANMVAGAAKSRFEGRCVSISTPSVAIGSGHPITPPPKALCISLPCSLTCGVFTIDIAIRDESHGVGAAA
jgi:chemotaxis protein CheX